MPAIRLALPEDLRTTLAAGITAATLEIIPALIIQPLLGVSPKLMFQAIASGLLGRSSFHHGWKTAALGIAFHLFISIVAAGIFVASSRRWPLLLRHPWRAGLLYGALCYVVMNFVVVPLSAMPSQGLPPWHFLAISIADHLLFFGLPIALVTRAFRTHARGVTFE